jgi:hypothetical protein
MDFLIQFTLLKLKVRNEIVIQLRAVNTRGTTSVSEFCYFNDLA